VYVYCTCWEGVAVTQNGKIVNDIFIAWLTEFMVHIHPSPGGPVFLILDCHNRTIFRSPRVAPSNSVHATDVLLSNWQTLDRLLTKLLNGIYSDGCSSWMRRNPSFGMGKCDLTGLVSEVFVKMSRMSLARNRLSWTGISWPVFV
jgi:hypothetical protein